MKKIIRFLLNVTMSPILFIWGFLDWFYEDDLSFIKAIKQQYKKKIK